MNNSQCFILVDNSGLLKDFADKYFLPYGIKTIVVKNDGQELLNKVITENPQAVMFDFCMTGYDGITFIEKLKQLDLEELPNLYIHTPLRNEELFAEAMEMGVKSVFLKPYDPDAIFERLAKKFTQKRKFTSPTTSRDELARDITEIMHTIGVPAHIKGFHYLRYAIDIAYKNDETSTSMTKQIYPSVAKKFETTPSRVERAIRHAIEVAFDRGEIDTLTKYFGYTINSSRGKPTNGEFIAMISDRLKMEVSV